MNYPMFALLAIIFIAYVYMKRSNKKKKSKNGEQPDQKIKRLEEELIRLKSNQP